MRELNYPVFTGATICSHAYSHILDMGEDVEVGGLTVHTGDLLHGDINGVTNIPLDIAAEVADLADEFLTAEQQVIDYAKQPGEKKISELVERRRAMGEALATLRQRVSRQL